MDAKKFLGIVVSIFIATSFLVWLSKWSDFQACLDNPKNDRGKCFTDYLILHPEIQNALELQKVCQNGTSVNCVIKIGENVAEKKIEENNR